MTRPSELLVLDASKKALPLFVGQAVTFLAGYGMAAALVWLLPATDMAHYGVLREALRWGAVGGIFGVATGVLRLAPERPGEQRDLLVTGSAVVLALSLAVVGVLHASAGLRGLLLGDPVAETLLLWFAWRIPCVALFRVCVALTHARGLLARKATLEGGERVVALAASVTGAAVGGLDGLVLGSIVGSVIVSLSALALALPRGGARPRVRADLVRPLFRVGTPQVAFLLLESLRPLLVLRVMNARGDGAEATGLLAAAMLFTLPLIAAPEALAQAIYPTMLGRDGESHGLDRTHGRLLREQAVVALPLLAVVGGLLAWLLPMVRDGAYAGAVAPAIVLLPGVAAHGLTAHTGYLVLVRHRLGAAAAVSGVVAVAAGALAWAAVPRWGPTGAAAALSVALVLRSALLVAVARRPAR